MAQRRSFLRRVLPWLLGYLVFQAVVGVVGRVAARRVDDGDESSTSIRRVRTHRAFELRPTNPALSSVRVDLAMGGATSTSGPCARPTPAGPPRSWTCGSGC